MLRVLAAALRQVVRCRARRRHRQSLAAIAALGERTMLDLGLDPDLLRREAAKPFWRR